MDKNTAAKLSKVNPVLRIKIAQVIANLAAQGLDVRVVSGLRSFSEQDALFAQGRTKPGEIVTNARAGQSNHNFALAVDLCAFIDNQPDWNDLKAFAAIGAEAKKAGLHWGGDWKKLKDLPHVEIGNLSVKECLALYRKGGLEAVWNKAAGLGQNLPTVADQIAAPDLQPGDKGDYVRVLQDKLVSLMYLREADGIFGEMTEKAVIAFQTDVNLRADGIVGSNTRLALGI